MLVDAAKYGDVEIPVFCYEPKLGQPVGACRMCLVEIEGIPKLQTACSTPVKDGMVVHTQTDRVHDAQRAVVEFLLINHPLDCPVCDKGGECPLQDITYGWGPGTSRYIEPKRHFKKPLELSPLVAIDRERCILCYRCVRFSQEISEDYQLILLERGAHSFVGTFDGHPYVAPFSGNIVELCPVGALTSSAYRFRARPWDIEGAGSVCTLCPAQCNVEFTVRDDRVMRVLARDNADVDDGWLCDKGRYAYQYVHVDERITQPLVREGTNLMPASWEKALDAAGTRAQEGRRPRGRAGRRGDLQRGGVPARAAVPRRARLRPPRLAPRRRAAARRRARARRPRAAGDGARPRVRPHRRADRVRPDRRRPDPRPAHPQGRAPPRHARSRSPARARPRSTRAPTSVVRIAPGGGGGAGSCRSRIEANDFVARHHRRRRGHRDRLRRAPARRPARRDRGARAAQPRRPPRARRPRRRRAARDPRERRTGAGCARPASPPATAPASPRWPSPAAAPPRSPQGLADADALDALPAARRPAAHAPGPRAVEGGARHRADRDRRTSR